MSRTWAIEDHLCKSCGGRILRCVTGNGMSPGGNPTFMCADCGKAAWGMGVGDSELCWCSFNHRRNKEGFYTCLPFAIIEARPLVKQKLINAFRNCGCEPDKGGVGIVLTETYRDILEEERKLNAE
jgi:hypothetical protein